MHGHPSKLICQLFECSVSVKISLVNVLPHIVVLVSSINSNNNTDICTLLTWRGTASQHMPKMAHFLGVKKYIGPG